MEARSGFDVSEGGGWQLPARRESAWDMVEMGPWVKALLGACRGQVVGAEGLMNSVEARLLGCCLWVVLIFMVVAGVGV